MYLCNARATAGAAAVWPTHTPRCWLAQWLCNEAPRVLWFTRKTPLHPRCRRHSESISIPPITPTHLQQLVICLPRLVTGVLGGRHG